MLFCSLHTSKSLFWKYSAISLMDDIWSLLPPKLLEFIFWINSLFMMKTWFVSLMIVLFVQYCSLSNIFQYQKICGFSSPYFVTMIIWTHSIEFLHNLRSLSFSCFWICFWASGIWIFSSRKLNIMQDEKFVMIVINQCLYMFFKLFHLQLKSRKEAIF